ncbi:MAG TPA: DNA primase catalytic subunit PriS [Pyrodictium sp.]|nr:DNA primase catalytic subunit PriS [Pyrodictium sp.]
MELDKTKRFLRHLFRSYYLKNSVWLPRDFSMREFAYQPWDSNTYRRHLAFRTVNEVHRLLSTVAPRHVYYSSAKYECPDEPDMDRKGWLGADLIFDIDADHLPVCQSKVIELTAANGERIELIDEECVRYAAFEALKLYDVLVYELGIPKHDIKIEFSGNRGFHITVYLDIGDMWAKASSVERREIINYLKAVDLLDETLNPSIDVKRRKRIIHIVPTAAMGGLRGRLGRIAVLIAEKKYGNKDLARILAKNEIISWKYLKSIFGDIIENIFDDAREELPIHVDEQVTIDTRRLIRVPYSLHGKTGLKVEPVDPQKLDKFELSLDLSPFQKRDKIAVVALVDTPPLSILGLRIRLRRGEGYRLPAPHAIYLMARGLAAVK